MRNLQAGVQHKADEYVRYDGDRIISTNTVEGYFSIFKRGMKGAYQHCSQKHLHRYLAEFDFCYNNPSALGVDDIERAEKMATGIDGKGPPVLGHRTRGSNCYPVAKHHMRRYRPTSLLRSMILFL